jgi:hypothetical protein
LPVPISGNLFPWNKFHDCLIFTRPGSELRRSQIPKKLKNKVFTVWLENCNSVTLKVPFASEGRKLFGEWTFFSDLNSASRRPSHMKRILSIALVGMFGAWTVAAQSSASVQGGASAQTQASVQTDKAGAQASGSGSASASGSSKAEKDSVGMAGGSSQAAVASGSKIDATLTRPLDAKKNKPGDQVEARTNEDVKQNGKVVMKKGTRLVGQVTQAQARESGQSQLGIVFDHAVLNNGQEVPLNASIQALAAAQSAATLTPASDDMMTSGSGMGTVSGTARGGGGLVGGVASTAGASTASVVNTAESVPVNAGGTLNAATRSTGAVGGLTSTGRLTSSSSGVFGLQGLSLDSAASSATQGSMIVSSPRNVHLDSGTQMLLTASGDTR